MTALEKALQQHWLALRPLLAIRNEEQYEQAIEHLNDLIDEIGTDEAHPLYELLDTLGTLIHAYEEQHHAIPDWSGGEGRCLASVYPKKIVSSSSWVQETGRPFWQTRMSSGRHERLKNLVLWLFEGPESCLWQGSPVSPSVSSIRASGGKGAEIFQYVIGSPTTVG